LTTLDVSGDGQSVTATAEPRGVQAVDACGSLTLSSSGKRDASAAPAVDCW
jgi:Tfp pilus assembly protein PilE